MKYDVRYLEHNPSKKQTKQVGGDPWETYDEKYIVLTCQDVEEFLDELFSLEKKFSMPKANVGKYTVLVDQGRVYVRGK